MTTQLQFIIIIIIIIMNEPSAFLKRLELSYPVDDCQLLKESAQLT